ncbi:Zn-ribbon domain-containing OB-fold protein [Rhodococcus sp. NPDC058505]|uniref:Zn-ribbon domain-containing OB-fold protein n=1 Tax=unclassified Rhodococcus (in: high G+C Gram-positive bacteria) TaxID=192944 RepID=UPI003654D8FF
MVHGRRALPELTELTATHWTSGASGRLSVQRCLRCLRWSFPPAPCCRGCWGTDLAFEPVSGKGALLTWAVVVEPVRAVPAPPYLVGVVDLVEGVRITLGLLGGGPDTPRVGAPMRLVFEQLDERIWLPLAEFEDSDAFEDRIEAVS